MLFSELMSGAAWDGACLTSPIPEDWAQGRTAYGGLSAALCAEAVRRGFPNLPPMRSAQVGFIGPASGVANVKPGLLRQGRSTTFVAADLATDGKIAARSLLIYGAARESEARMQDLPCPDITPRAEVEEMPHTSFQPQFLRQFEIHIAEGGMPFAGGGTHRSL